MATEYNLNKLAEAYFDAYSALDRQLLAGHRAAIREIDSERSFIDLAYDERGCIKAGLKAVILEIDPEATFIL
jgi:hypothetical protein